MIKKHQNTVFSIALRVTGDYGAAEVVAQDVFLDLHRSLSRMKSADHTASGSAAGCDQNCSGGWKR